MEVDNESITIPLTPIHNVEFIEGDNRKQKKMADDFKGTVIIYSSIGSPACMKAKLQLAKLGIPYTDVSLDSFPQCQEEMERRTHGASSVPQIFFNELHIGGADELRALIEDEKRFEKVMEMLRTREAPASAPTLPNPASAIDYVEGVDGEEFMCSPDECSRLVSEMKKANLIKDNRAGLMKTYKNSFKGQDLVDWLIAEKKLDRKQALEKGQELIDRQFGQQTSRKTGDTFSPDRYYQLLEDDENQALNSGPTTDPNPLKAADFNESLRRLMLAIFDESMDYKRLEESEQFERYLVLIKELQRVDIESANRDEKLALFLNVHNMMLIHEIVKLGVPGNIWQRRKFFNSVYYLIGGYLYSLQSIENGILRGNRKGIGMLWRPFGKQDERLPFVLNELEPMVHFALTSATKGSPPLRAYSCKGVIDELRHAVAELFDSDDNVKVDTARSCIYLPKTFKWFADDFGSSNEKIIKWIVSHMKDSEKKRALDKLFCTGTWTIDYLNYDWSFNGKDREQ